MSGYGYIRRPDGPGALSQIMPQDQIQQPRSTAPRGSAEVQKDISVRQSLAALSFAPAGRWMVPGLTAVSPTTDVSSEVVQTIVLPFLPADDMVISDIAFQTGVSVGFGDSGVGAYVVLYSDRGDFFPSDLIFQSDLVCIADSTSSYTISSLSINLRAGRTYWLGYWDTHSTDGCSFISGREKAYIRTTRDMLPSLGNGGAGSYATNMACLKNSATGNPTDPWPLTGNTYGRDAPVFNVARES